ncbi:MAG TPA: beta-ketoacyl-[acyl-carrier-protein] synthase family protein, partial [Candidatus Binatia bacterium]
RKAVITGCGSLSPLGSGVSAFWDALLAGRSGLAPIRSFETTGYTHVVAGEIKDFAPERALSSDEIRRLDRISQYALIAAREALSDAAIDLQQVDRARVGVILATALGGMLVGEAYQRHQHDGHAFDARRLLHFPYYAVATRLARELGMCGPVVSPSIACASGTHAVGLALEFIRRGQADVFIVGGVETICQFVVSGFNCLRATTANTVRPFDARRDGLALGEGAAILVVEEVTHAQARGARVDIEVAGTGLAGDAVHMTAPARDGAGAARAMRAALADAACAPQAVDFISAHGTGTVYNDAMEMAAITAVFAEAGAAAIPVNSIKGAIGHTLGAAGSFEAIMCVQILRQGLIPPTVNCEQLDPGCPLDIVRGEPRRCDAQTVLSTSSAFAGNNAAIVLRRRSFSPGDCRVSPNVGAQHAAPLRKEAENTAYEPSDRSFIDSSHELRSPLHHENEARRPLGSLPLLSLPATGEGQDGGDFLSSPPGEQSKMARGEAVPHRTGMTGAEGQFEPVVITGIGVVSPFGHSVEELVRGFCGAQHAAPLQERDAELVTDIPISAVPEDKRARVGRLDRLCRFFLSASYLAVRAAALKIGHPDVGAQHAAPERVGLSFGTGLGCLLTDEEYNRKVVEQGPSAASPRLFAYTVSSAAAGEVSIALGIKGPNVTAHMGFAAGLGALGYGYDLIQMGKADVVLAGGADVMGPALLVALRAMGLLKRREQARPFLDAVPGVFPGEAAVVAVLERRDRARQRGAPCWGRIEGYSAGFEPTITRHDRQHTGVTHTLNRAIAVSRLQPRDIGAVMCSAHGTPIDHTERAALVEVFGSTGAPLLLAPKVVVGDCLGASGMLALALAAGAWRHAPRLHDELSFDLNGKAVTGAEAGVRLASKPLVLVNALCYSGNIVSLVFAPTAES